MGRGGHRSVKKNPKLNGKNDIGRSVEQSLDEYFRKLDGEPPHGVYDMVMGHVEHALLAAILARAQGNQTQAADMLGINRNTLRAKLSKHRLI
jgi:Fis family transcriptional regulator